MPAARQLAVAIIFAAAISPFAADAAAAYANWVKPWLETPVTSPALDGAGLKLVVSTVVGEAEVAVVGAMTPVERAQLAYRIKVSATEVATNGLCRGYFVCNTSAMTSGNRRLTAEDSNRLEHWLAHLSDDRSQLPPAGRRVVVQTLADGQWRVRVFDGNNLPLELKAVLELLANPCDQLL